MRKVIKKVIHRAFSVPKRSIRGMLMSSRTSPTHRAVSGSHSGQSKRGKNRERTLWSVSMTAPPAAMQSQPSAYRLSTTVRSE